MEVIPITLEAIKAEEPELSAKRSLWPIQLTPLVHHPKIYLGVLPTIELAVER
jgi:hypothetical protein